MGSGCSADGRGRQTPEILKIYPSNNSNNKKSDQSTINENNCNNEQAVETRINAIVNDIWMRYDIDHNGILDSEEFSILVSDTMSSKGFGHSAPTNEEVEELLMLVDEDGNGTITKEEFHSMMHNLMVMNSTERVEMAGLSASFCKLMIFVESLTSEIMTNISMEEEHRDYINSGATDDLEENVKLSQAECTPRRKNALRARLLPISHSTIDQQELEHEVFNNARCKEVASNVTRSYEGKNDQEHSVVVHVKHPNADEGKQNERDLMKWEERMGDFGAKYQEDYGNVLAAESPSREELINGQEESFDLNGQDRSQQNNDACGDFSWEPPV